MWRPKQRSAKPMCSFAAPLFALTLVGAAVHVGVPAPLSMSPQEDAVRQVSAAVSLAAAIDTSSNAVGIAESELFYMTEEEVGIAMDTMQSMGVTQVRMFVPWYWVEPAPGLYNWANVDKVVDAAEERGIAVLGAVSSTPTWATDYPSPYGAPRDPEDFGAFMGALATRYGAGAGDPETARISAYEIWNEPHAAPFWGPQPDAAAYTEVLKAGYDAVKAVDPTGTVVGGVVYAGQSWGNGYNIGAVDFIEGMYEAGAAGYFDALSYHPYNNDWKFSDGVGSPISAAGILEDIQTLMAQNGDGGKTVWTSEYGLPTSDVSEAKQAEFIDNFLDTWSELDGVGPTFVYSLVDLNSGSTYSEDTYGLFRDDWTPKEAAAAVEAWITENGPLATGEVVSAEEKTLPVDAVTEEPTVEEPADPVAQTVTNWQQAWADAVAGWTTAVSQAMNPTSAPTTTVSARTAAEPEVTPAERAELVGAIAEATASAQAAIAEDTASGSSPSTTSESAPTNELRSNSRDLTPDADLTPRAALAEATQDESARPESDAAESKVPAPEAAESVAADATATDTAARTESDPSTAGSTATRAKASPDSSRSQSSGTESKSGSDSASTSRSSERRSAPRGSDSASTPRSADSARTGE